MYNELEWCVCACVCFMTVIIYNMLQEFIKIKIMYIIEEVNNINGVKNVLIKI